MTMDQHFVYWGVVSPPVSPPFADYLFLIYCHDMVTV